MKLGEGPGWANNVIQLGPCNSLVPNKNGDVFHLDGTINEMMATHAKEGMPVTYEGKVIGKITSVIDDSINMTIDKEHEAWLNEKLNLKKGPHVQ